MILTYYTHYRGGTNNLKVAVDTKTGISSSSLLTKEHAEKALKRKLSRIKT